MKKLLLTFFVFVVVSINAFSAVYVETWDSSTMGWKIKDLDGGTVYGGLSWAGTLGTHSGALKIDGGIAEGSWREDIIYADSTGSGANLSGNKSYAVSDYIVFDFYSYANNAPVEINAYFYSSTGDRAWFNKLTAPTVSGWTHYEVQFGMGYGTGWYLYPGSGTASEYYSDLSDVDEIGISIRYLLSTGGQIYGLDNFSVVPEPSEWVILVFTLLSLCYTFRERLNAVYSAALVKIRS